MYLLFQCKYPGNSSACTSCNGEQFLDGDPIGKCIASAKLCPDGQAGVVLPGLR